MIFNVDNFVLSIIVPDMRLLFQVHLDLTETSFGGNQSQFCYKLYCELLRNGLYNKLTHLEHGPRLAMRGNLLFVALRTT